MADMELQGLTWAEIGRRLGKSTVTIWQARQSAGYQGLRDRAAAIAAQRAEHMLSIARPSAVAALQAILDASPVGDSGVDVKARLEAARAVLGASGPPTARQREAAEADVLKRLGRVDPDLAAKAADALSGEADAAYAALSDDELYRIARGEQ